MENHKNEFQFSLESILGFVWRGIVVGLIAGFVVSIFRLAIEKIFLVVMELYKSAHYQPIILLSITVTSIIAAVIIGFFIKSDPDIKGSGIPHVEGELKGMLSPDWFSIVWKKFIAGILAISSGLMLGREGPSIQLGAMTGKGIAQFSRLVWITALVASLVANFVSLNIFGLTPVLALPSELPSLNLNFYWIFLLMGLFLGILGFIYEWVILRFHVIYDYLGKLFHLPSHLYGILAVIFILPIGYYFPQLLGGGNGLIVSLPRSNLSLMMLGLFFLIRFLWSMLSYSSGLPGGIFLPILALGSLAGAFFAVGMQYFGIISHQQISLFVVLGMAGYFGAISKAPLTAMILVTEMVGDLKQLMAIGIVTMVSYIVMDLLKGEPIYEAMLAKMTFNPKDKVMTPTLIELTVSDKISGKYVRDLELPENVLITTQIHHKTSAVVSGNTILNAGDTIFLVVNESEIKEVREQLM
ncbi:TPA: ClC family H(+)/Cl(-) exchange transporter [Streptococcus agalactiae]